ncbi:HlyD family secretion protein [Formivibrio citricus]|uniref:HlyD family secretion protein n=1 Tax=Formivibrio citricus TaxID=83765 RepID=A0A1I4Y7U3_9NEIS|nr:efflux RND transporter periplasmic adaptor subunit [Formivibrio citricus]SFN34148.1 HlyD family secretion protein [Formivibrio citricus]
MIPKKLFFNRWTALLLTAGLLGGGYALYRQAKAPKPGERYLTAEVTQGPVAQTVSANGTLNPVKLVSVGTQVSGTVKTLYTDFNARVKENQILAQLDDSLLRAQLGQSEANLVSARASLALAQSNFARIDKLFKQEYVSRQEYDQSHQALQAAQAAVAQTTAAVQKDRTNLGYSTIRSPVSGIVISRDVDVGQTVAASLQTPTLFKIAQDLRKMQIDSSFAEADVGQIKAGQNVSFRVDAFPGREFKGEVKEVRLNPTTQQNVVTYNVVVSVDNPEEILLPGMTAYVNIHLAARDNTVLIPSTALRFRPTAGNKNSGAGKPASGRASEARQGGGQRGEGRGNTVYVLQDNQPKAVRIKLGIGDGKFSELVEGDLKPGDRLIVEDTWQESAKKPGAANQQRPPMRMF